MLVIEIVADKSFGVDISKYYENVAADADANTGQIANINKVKDAIQDLKKDTQVKELIKLKPKLDEFFQKLDDVVSGIDLNLNH